MPARRPHVVAHVAVSLDGATTGFEPDVAPLLRAGGHVGGGVRPSPGQSLILAQEQALAEAPRRPGAADGPLLAVVDGRGRVREWEALGAGGATGPACSRCTRARPPRPAAPHDPRASVRGSSGSISAGAGGLAALGERHGARVVRVDSGGGLTGALIEAWPGRRAEPARPSAASSGRRDRPALARSASRRARPASSRWAPKRLDDGLLWLRYRVLTRLDPRGKADEFGSRERSHYRERAGTATEGSRT